MAVGMSGFLTGCTVLALLFFNPGKKVDFWLLGFLCPVFYRWFIYMHCLISEELVMVI